MNLWQKLESEASGEELAEDKSRKAPAIPRLDLALNLIAAVTRVVLDARIWFGLAVVWAVFVSDGVANLITALLVCIGAFLTAKSTYLKKIPDRLKWLVWSDLNKPLMRRLSLEAPGTYAHSMAIANLSEAGCNAIGADGLLARVGTYYHDIGKLRKPQHFIENQRGQKNPHDKLKPSTSANIIKSHVRDGLELADEYGVPKELKAFITEHHGTNPIAYFLAKAKERDVSANDFEYTYPGPKPRSIETAVCMLADGVEAKVRSLSEPTAVTISEAVDSIFKARLDAGQLSEAPITLAQLTVVRDQFIRTLKGMYHDRIEYPTVATGKTLSMPTPINRALA